ncbi:metal ABC transporter permease [Thermaerobacter subterraneus]|uniref:ABC-type Mn2+/Zn2+ transport system, permease component n=1 Tax=Thermaerobacter subterraneus DSM 13965 TaxID=867903 RepID=K6P2B1_9FIRM|nr:metal ABC transporter permease [Thermaerobacter subterraneus]EKP95210.1 ABC-type Mn2+/Zn2+ transport system, permease component [Thermaerobacter subterraneus DSM 13965]
MTGDPGWLDILAEPLRYPFMVRALAAGVLVAVAGAVTGSFLLVRRWSLLGDAISHAVLPGVAVAYLLGWPYFTGALASALLTAAGIGFLERNTRLKSDAATGLLFLGAFALGLAILSRARSSVDVFHILFGNVLGVSRADLVLMAVVAAVAAGLVALLFKELQLWAFDPVTAEVAGLPVRALHYLMMVLVSATLVAALQAVGVVLALAMLVTPPATAYLLVRRFPALIGLAVVLGTVAAVTGLYLSFYLDVASGPAMVLVAMAGFVVALVLAPEQGLLARLLQRRRTARLVAAEDVLKALHELGVEGGEAVARGAGPAAGPAAAAAASPRGVPLDVLAGWTGLTRREVRAALARLVARGLAAWDPEPEAGDPGPQAPQPAGDGAGGGPQPAGAGFRERRGPRAQGPALGARLTAAGVREARRLIRTHRLWERYLTDVAGMAWEDVHQVAHELEHATPPHLAEEMAEALGHPARDPHGAPIPTPAGDVPAEPGPPPVALDQLPAGTRAVVARVDDEDPDLLGRLRRAGLVPGTRLEVLGRARDGLWVRREEASQVRVPGPPAEEPAGRRGPRPEPAAPVAAEQGAGRSEAPGEASGPDGQWLDAAAAAALRVHPLEPDGTLTRPGPREEEPA